MKATSSVWLRACLFLCVGFGTVHMLCGASPASGLNNAGDAPAGTRSAETSNSQLNAAHVVNSDLQILERARAANDDVYASLESFVCNEQVNRFKGNLNGQAARTLDTVTAKLSFERGVEQYTNVLQNNHPRAGMSSLPGAWSEGEFGTLLLQTQQLLTSQNVEFDSFADVRGEQAAIYHFNVSSDESPWDLSVAGKHYRLPFRTNVWISVNSGEILRIERSSTSIDSNTRISGIEWSISLDHFNISGKSWLLPATGSYTVLYSESHRREWNEISFSDYQRYGSQATLTFN